MDSLNQKLAELGFSTRAEKIDQDVPDNIEELLLRAEMAAGIPGAENE